MTPAASLSAGTPLRADSSDVVLQHLEVGGVASQVLPTFF
jgi:hypothetical protein